MKIDIMAMLRFLRAQIVRLPQAVLENHGLELEKVIIWVGIINAFIAIASLVSLFMTQFFSSIFNASTSFSIVTRYGDSMGLLVTSTIYSLIVFVGFAVISGYIVKLRSGRINWNEWIECLFLCSLPLDIASLVINLSTILSILAMCSAVAISSTLFYRAIKYRFKLTRVSDYKILKIILVSACLIVGIKSWRAISIISSIQRERMAANTPSTLPQNPTDPLPDKTVNKILKLHSGDSKKQRADMQYAKAVWLSLSAVDIDPPIIASMKATHCLVELGISDDYSKIDSLVLWNAELSRKYLAFNRRIASQVFENEKYSPTACE